MSVIDSNAVLASARRRLPGHLALLQTLVETNSHADNRPGVDSCLRTLTAALGDVGFASELLSGSGQGGDGRSLQRNHLRAERRRAPEGSRRILVLGHVDTVFAPQHDFRLTVGDQRWQGPGVIDMKAGLVTALLTFALLDEMGALDRADWRVLMVTDEEQGSPTALDLLKAEARDADLALCFEAARPCGGLVVERKGLGEATVVVRGRTGHSGIDHDSAANAFTALCRLVIAAESLEQEIDGLTISPGGPVLSAPASLSSIPNRASCQLEWRFKRPGSGADTLTRLRALAQAIGHETGASIEIDGHVAHPPMARTAAVDDLLGRYVRAAARLGIITAGVGTAGVGDINEVAAAGVTCLDGVGPEGAGFHTEDEHLVVDSIPRRAAMNALALADYLGATAAQS